jgi:hypothetical protein
MEHNSQNQPATPARTFVLRASVLGAAIFLLSVLSGIVMLFWREYPSGLSQVPRRTIQQLLFQATLGPLFFGAVFLFPLSALLALVLTIAFVIGFRTRRFWLVTVCFLLIGLYWLWLVKLISEGVFD